MTTTPRSAPPRSLIRATVDARRAGLSSSAISAVVASSWGNVRKRRTGAALLDEIVAKKKAVPPEKLPLKKKKKKSAKPDEPLKDDPPLEDDDDQDDDDQDDDPDDEDEDASSGGDEGAKRKPKKSASAAALNRRLSALERAERRGRGADAIGDPLLRRTLEAAGHPTTLSALEHASAVATTRARISQFAAVPFAPLPAASERAELDKVARLAGYGSHRELQAAARKAEAGYGAPGEALRSARRGR